MRFAPVQDTRFGRSIEAAGRYNANGYKLAGAVRQFCIINALVVIHTASVFVIILVAGGLPPVSRKGEFVGAIVAACSAVHLFLDKSLYLFFVQDFPDSDRFFTAALTAAVMVVAWALASALCFSISALTNFINACT